MLLQRPYPASQRASRGSKERILKLASSASSRSGSVGGAADSAPHLPLQDSPELRRALAAVDLPVLLMTYVHLSHDEAMLDQFAPHIPPLSTGQLPTAPDELVAEPARMVEYSTWTKESACRSPFHCFCSAQQRSRAGIPAVARRRRPMILPAR